METSLGTATAEPLAEVAIPAVTLTRFLSSAIWHGFCFCCSSPTALLLDGDGAVLARCAACGAEIGTEETGFVENGNLVLQAA